MDVPCDARRPAVLSLYFLTACFCMIAFSFAQLRGYTAFIFFAAVIVLTFRLLRNMGVFMPEPNDAQEEAGRKQGLPLDESDLDKESSNE